MDPHTGELHPLYDADELNSALRNQAQLMLVDGTPAPDTWVVFRKGERFDLKGQPFVIEWIGKDGILLVPQQAKILSTEKVPRNAPCPCGSGNKYKRCCGK